MQPAAGEGDVGRGNLEALLCCGTEETGKARLDLTLARLFLPHRMNAIATKLTIWGRMVVTGTNNWVNPTTKRAVENNRY